MALIGWVASVFLIIGFVLIGKKCRCGFIVTAVACALWATVGLSHLQYDLFSLNVVFVLLNVYNYIKWNREMKVITNE